ncbi:MAG: bifunctional folylpolyglutamate synthase/dihydrofolate synthase [Flavobacteriaceae bacterium]|nr:bifunctional folylpolyglutamate synthase/dihydrofolate synthase [Flavobacteriaceae bacterium]
MKTYEEIRSWLYEQLPYYQKQGSLAFKPDLKKMQDFMRYLGNPHDAFSSIHVAGTNGKGSTSHMITSILMEAGYKVGLYTSPHLKDFTERTRINGVEMDSKYVVDFVQDHQTYFLEARLSFFELTVGMAFSYFKQHQIEIAVVEVGLGGRLDATNIINPILSVITNIGLDHTQFLGTKLDEIAREKAGIIKSKTLVVIGETQPETTNVFSDVAKKHEAPILWADQKLKSFFKTDLRGIYQQKNIQTATVALEGSSLDKINKDCISRGLLNVTNNTGLLGRWQLLNHEPTIVADVTHNVEGFRYVVEQIKATNYQNLHLVLGFVKGKKLEDILCMLPKNADYYFCTPNIHRAEELSVLQNLAKKYKLNSKTFSTVVEAYESAFKNAQKRDFIYVGGSTFVVAEIL